MVVVCQRPTSNKPLLRDGMWSAVRMAVMPYRTNLGPRPSERRQFVNSKKLTVRSQLQVTSWRISCVCTQRPAAAGRKKNERVNAFSRWLASLHPWMCVSFVPKKSLVFRRGIYIHRSIPKAGAVCKFRHPKRTCRDWRSPARKKRKSSDGPECAGKSDYKDAKKLRLRLPLRKSESRSLSSDIIHLWRDKLCHYGKKIRKPSDSSRIFPNENYERKGYLGNVSKTHQSVYKPSF